RRTSGRRCARRDADRPNDTAIAGHAIAAGAILVTNNVREFERVPGLVLEDWVK
ncbi:type II toxin-antitoxin system VapC family toxin, partial [Klebsiella pneumoniae]|nr:type II toxin-antitoxin system VapC family toxin [Klebsiella pneumoniae]